MVQNYSTKHVFIVRNYLFDYTGLKSFQDSMNTNYFICLLKQQKQMKVIYLLKTTTCLFKTNELIVILKTISK